MHMFEEGSIRVFKMASGEEIIAKITDVNRDVLTLQEPLLLAMTGSGAGLMPATILGDTDKPIYLNLNMVVLHATANEKAYQAYQQQTSNIIIPDGPSVPKNIIMG